MTRRVLLQEYGGDDGWPFIEADAYKLLIDTILDDQEDADAGEERNEEKVPLLVVLLILFQLILFILLLLLLVL